MSVTIIAAVARNGVIGRGQEIPWRVPGEQQRFKQVTMGHTLVMGRRTYDAIGRPLPGRTTIVVTRQPDWTADGVTVAHSVREALSLASGEVFVAGGAEIYAEALPFADRMRLTEIDQAPEGDVFFPSFDPTEWHEVARESLPEYTIVTYERMAALAFHAATKYYEAGDGIAMGPNREDAIWERDWSIEPYPYKVYETVQPIPLLEDIPAETAISGLEALSGTRADFRAVFDSGTLARIGFLSNGLLGRKQTVRSGGSAHQRVVEYRTAGATGARYHLELYFVCAELPDLAAGVYQYSALDHSLRMLRRGDYRGVLVDATGERPAIASAPVVMAVTSTFWRNAWRYKARAYRHAYWDAGTSLAQALAASASIGVPASVVVGYADAPLNDLLGVDGEREAVLALCALGETTSPVPPVPELPALDLPTRPISSSEVTFPEIPAMHRASELSSGPDAANWRASSWFDPDSAPHGELIPLEPLPPERAGSPTLDELVRSRRSTRRYEQDRAVPFQAFSTLLDRSTRELSADFPTLYDHYLIVNDVEGLSPGLYVHHPRLGALERLRDGDFRAEARRVAANQWYVADAHVSSYYLTDLDRVLAAFGNRGYRAAQLQAALSAGRLHLATHALGLGACGSTSFDDEVIELFAPNAAGKAYLFVTVFGVPRRKHHPG